MSYKKVYWHGTNSKLGMFTYRCKNCNSLVIEEYSFCPKCGLDFDSGETHRSSYKKGYEQAKTDIVRIILGGKQK